MKTAKLQTIDCAVVSLDAHRMTREIQRFRAQSALDQWREIEQSWPLPMGESIALDGEIVELYSKLEKARNELRALALTSRMVQNDVEAVLVVDIAPGDRRSAIDAAAVSTTHLAQEASRCRDYFRSLDVTANTALSRVRLSVQRELVRSYNRLATLVPLAAAHSDAFFEAHSHLWDVEKTLVCLRLACLCIEAEAEGAAALCGEIYSKSGVLQDTVNAYVGAALKGRADIIDRLGDSFAWYPESLREFQIAMSELWRDSAPAYAKALLPAHLWSR